MSENDAQHGDPTLINSQNQTLTSLINSMADAVIATDSNGLVDVYNGAALNILDLNSSINGKPIKQFINLETADGHAKDIDELIKGATTATSSSDYLLVYKDGSKINIYLSIAPVHSGYGTGGSGYVLLLRDITREKALEEERDDFISVVSHELRNPVAIVEGNISNAQFVVEKNSDISIVKKTLDQAYEQVAFLAGMIEDLATLSRAERGVLNVEPEDINPNDLVKELVANYERDASKKALHIYAEIDPALELLKSSRLYVKEVLQNFITNAIKYTERGSVTVGAKPAEGGVLFTVQDTGIGISTSDRARIFDKFFRSDDQRTRKENGTGLGLYVTQKLSKLLGAKIDLESELNMGSKFSIFIPNLQTDKPQDSIQL